MHSDLRIKDVSEESTDFMASQWILSCFSTLLCISVATMLQSFGTWEGGVFFFSAFFFL